MSIAARRSLVVVLTAVLLVVAGCGDGGDGEGGDIGADSTADVDELSPVPDPLESLAEPAPGQGAAVIGFEELSFTVEECVEGPRPDDPPEASLDYSVAGVGETSDGPFSVSVTRFRSETGVGDVVITETATIVFGTGAEERGIQSKRTTAGPGGGWLDLADADADGPLIERRGDAFDVRATFGPDTAQPGDDEGLETGRLRARCPA